MSIVAGRWCLTLLNNSQQLGNPWGWGWGQDKTPLVSWRCPSSRQPGLPSSVKPDSYWLVPKKKKNKSYQMVQLFVYLGWVCRHLNNTWVDEEQTNLWNPLWGYEAGGLDDRKSGGRKHVNQVDFGLGWHDGLWRSNALSTNSRWDDGTQTQHCWHSMI